MGLAAPFLRHSTGSLRLTACGFAYGNYPTMSRSNVSTASWCGRWIGSHSDPSALRSWARHTEQGGRFLFHANKNVWHHKWWASLRHLYPQRREQFCAVAVLPNKQPRSLHYAFTQPSRGCLCVTILVSKIVINDLHFGVIFHHQFHVCFRKISKKNNIWPQLWVPLWMCFSVFFACPHYHFNYSCLCPHLLSERSISGTSDSTIKGIIGFLCRKHVGTWKAHSSVAAKTEPAKGFYFYNIFSFLIFFSISEGLFNNIIYFYSTLFTILHTPAEELTVRAPCDFPSELSILYPTIILISPLSVNKIMCSPSF